MASVAVPGLDPVSVQPVAGAADRRYDVAFVVDAQHRRWVVRAPTAPVAAAQLEMGASVTTLLSRRLPFSVPTVRGFAPLPDGRASVCSYLPGRPVDLSRLEPGPGLAAEIGRTIAHVHNLDRQVYEEAGVPIYHAEACRARHLVDLDRGASTGQVPSGLLQRWERALEDVRLWRFAVTPVHGAVNGSALLATFEDEQDAATGRISAVLGWDEAVVGDPAVDIAAVVAHAAPEAVESVLESYANTRIERPDPYLEVRARLVHELRALTRLLRAVAGTDPQQVGRATAQLRDIDERTAGDDALVPPSPEPPPARPAVVVDGIEAGHGIGAGHGIDELDTQGFDVAAEFGDETQPLSAESLLAEPAKSGSESAGSGPDDPSMNHHDPEDPAQVEPAADPAGEATGTDVSGGSTRPPPSSDNR